MTVKIITLGCKVNQYESQAMLEALLAAGFTQAAPDEAAGVVVVNSCTVTAQSDHKVRQALRRAKKDNPGAVTVLTGCMPQAFPDAAAALLEADIVLGNTKRSDLVPRLQEFLATKQRVVDIAPHVTGEPFEPLHVSEFHGRTRAFLKKMCIRDRPLAGGRSCGRSPAPSPGGAGKAVLGWSWLSRDLSLVSTMVKELRSETGASAVGAGSFLRKPRPGPKGKGAWQPSALPAIIPYFPPESNGGVSPARGV